MRVEPDPWHASPHWDEPTMQLAADRARRRTAAPSAPAGAGTPFPRQGPPASVVSGRSRRRGRGGWCLAVALIALGLAVVSVLQHYIISGAPEQVADLSALSPQLAEYAQSQGTGLTVAVYVPASHQYYAYNEDVQTVMASTAKVPILLTLLNDAEAQQRALTAQETQLATEMIEESDNDEALTLYQEVTVEGVQSYLASIGIQGMQMQDLMGYSTTTPLAMVELLEALRSGRTLNAQDRAFALDLMGNIDPAQQMGIGQTAPSGATYYMKDGWVIAPDNTWTTASVGIVTIGTRTYDLAVYAQGRASEDGGWPVVNHVCGAVAAAMSQN